MFNQLLHEILMDGCLKSLTEVCRQYSLFSPYLPGQEIHLCGSPSPTPLPEAGSPTAGCTGQRPGGSSISPEKETPQPPWAACPVLRQSSLWKTTTKTEKFLALYLLLPSISCWLFAANPSLGLTVFTVWRGAIHMGVTFHHEVTCLCAEVD